MSERPLYIGIDGGGSKVEFVVADDDLNVIKQVRVDHGSNPWAVGIEGTCKVLDDGLMQLAEYLPRVCYLVAGIGGQFVRNRYTDRIEETLRSHCPRVSLVGDLPIAFRAQSPTQYGIIAIAGTGSSAVQLYRDGSHYVHDGVGVGGRDLGYWLAQAYRREGVLPENARQYLLSIAPSVGSNLLCTTNDFYVDAYIKDIPRNLPSSESDVLYPAFRPWLDAAADRWKFKLFGIVKKYIETEDCEPREVNLVLSGSLWRNDYILRSVQNQLAIDHPAITVLSDPSAHPVMGAVRMAIAAAR